MLIQFGTVIEVSLVAIPPEAHEKKIKIIKPIIQS